MTTTRIHLNRKHRPDRVYTQAWYSAPVLGKVLLAVGVLLEQNGKAGLSDGVELLANRGWRALVKSMSRDEFERCAERAARRFPSLVCAADLVRRSKRFRDSGFVRE